MTLYSCTRVKSEKCRRFSQRNCINSMKIAYLLKISKPPNDSVQDQKTTFDRLYSSSTLLRSTYKMRPFVSYRNSVCRMAFATQNNAEDDKKRMQVNNCSFPVNVAMAAGMEKWNVVSVIRLKLISEVIKRFHAMFTIFDKLLFWRWMLMAATVVAHSPAHYHSAGAHTNGIMYASLVEMCDEISDDRKKRASKRQAEWERVCWLGVVFFQLGSISSSWRVAVQNTCVVRNESKRIEKYGLLFSLYCRSSYWVLGSSRVSFKLSFSPFSCVQLHRLSASWSRVRMQTA